MKLQPPLRRHQYVSPFLPARLTRMSCEGLPYLLLASSVPSFARPEDIVSTGYQNTSPSVSGMKEEGFW